MRYVIARDNAAGGSNGPETVSLNDPTVNNQFTYLLAAKDFEFENNGDSLLNSMAMFTVQNNVQNFEFPKLMAMSVNATNQFYFFGCLTVEISKNPN